MKFFYQNHVSQFFQHQSLAILYRYHYSKMKDWVSLLLRAKYYISRSNPKLVGKRLDDIASKWVREHIVCADLSGMNPYPFSDHPEIIKSHYLYAKYRQLKSAGQEHEFMTFVMGANGD